MPNKINRLAIFATKWTDFILVHPDFQTATSSIGIFYKAFIAVFNRTTADMGKCEITTAKARLQSLLLGGFDENMGLGSSCIPL